MVEFGYPIQNYRHCALWAPTRTAYNEFELQMSGDRLHLHLSRGIPINPVKLKRAFASPLEWELPTKINISATKTHGADLLNDDRSQLRV